MLIDKRGRTEIRQHLCEVSDCNSGRTDSGGNLNRVLLGNKKSGFLNKRGNACIHCLKRILIDVDGKKLILAECNGF